MSDLTDYARDLLSRALCGRQPGLPVAVYAALGTGGSVATGLSGEPAGNGYSRQRVSFRGTGAQNNGEALRFTFSAAAGTLTHLGLFDAATAGNPLTLVAMDQPVVMSGSGVVTIAAEALSVSPT